ncbi:MAG: NUDIX hydrolase [Candidatus Falkowbacteria bacterium]|nr:NUDIX hydrolase [Candidatus Falkowbacteria bacterium]
MSIIIASGPVIIENSKVLLNRSGEDDFWKFCGGKTLPGELNLKQTAIRRVKEEMGLNIEIIQDQPYLFYTEKEDDNQSVILAHFLAKRLSEVEPGIGVRDWRWFTFDELSKENLAPNIFPVLTYFGFNQ